MNSSYNLLDIVQTIILLLGFALTIWKIHQNTEARKLSLFHDMCKEQQNIQLELFKITRDIKNTKQVSSDKEKVENFKKGEQSDVEKEKSVMIEHYLNFLDHLALLINERKIDEKLSKKYFNSIVDEAVKCYKDQVFPNYVQLLELHRNWNK